MSQRSSPELVYLGPRSPTPQLAIRSGGPISSPLELTPEEEHATVRNSATRAAYHASLIPRAQGLFNSPLEETIRAFRACPPTRATSPHDPTLHNMWPVRGAIELSPSPEPLPLPLRIRNRTPSPTDDEPLPLYTRDDTPPPPPTPSTDEETLVEASDHPGPGWHVNYDQQGIRYMFTMPSDDPDIQEVAKYLRIDTNEGDPILLATMGSGLPVHRAPLHAKPDSTPRPAFTEQELIFFRGGEAYTSMVNTKLAEEDDVGLQAEVYRYRISIKKERTIARQMATLKYKYQRQRQDSWNSARRLAEANTYHRLYPDVIRDQIYEDGPGQEVAVRQLTSTTWRPYHTDHRGCEWCQHPGHVIGQCSMIRRCLLCAKWGHLEKDCYRSHAVCDHSLACRVPPGHPRGRTICRAAAARDVRRG
jgi:hypothetical protein